jgi:hypothetical protein
LKAQHVIANLEYLSCVCGTHLTLVSRVAVGLSTLTAEREETREYMMREVEFKIVLAVLRSCFYSNVLLHGANLMS